MMKMLASDKVLYDSSGHRPVDRIGFGDNMTTKDSNIFCIRSLSVYCK
jgi:hypothetical protein